MQMNAVDHHEHHLVTEARLITRRLGVTSDEAQRAWLDAVDALVLAERYQEAMDRLVSLSQSIDLDSTPQILTLNLKLLRLANRLGYYDQVAKHVQWCHEFIKRTDSCSEIYSDGLLKLAVYAGWQSWSGKPTHKSNEIASESSNESSLKEICAAPIVSDLIESKPYYSELQRVILSWREHASSTQLFEEAMPLVRNMNHVSDKVLLTHFLALELVSFPGGSETLIEEDTSKLVNFWSIAAADIIDPKLFAEDDNVEGSSATLSSLYQKLPAAIASSPIWTPLRVIIFLQGLSTWPISDITNFAESQFVSTDPLRIDDEHHKSVLVSLHTLRDVYKLDERGKESAFIHETSHDTVARHLNSMIRRGLYEGKMGLVKSSLELLADHRTSQDLSDKRSTEMQVLTHWYHRFNLSSEVNMVENSTNLSSDARFPDFSGIVLAQSNLVLGQATKTISSINISQSDAESMKRWVLDVERKYTATSLEYVTANYALCSQLETVDPKTAVQQLRKLRNVLVNSGFSSNEFLADLTLRELDALYTLGRDRECVESAESLLVRHTPLSAETECKLRIAQLRSTANMRQKNGRATEIVTSAEKNLLPSQPLLSRKLEKTLRIELMRNAEVFGEYARALEFVLPLYNFQTTFELQHSDVYLLTSIARLAELTSNTEIEGVAWTALSTLETPMSQFYKVRSKSSETNRLE